jgi:hypothetical protein
MEATESLSPPMFAARSIADSPRVLRVAHIPRNNRTRRAFEVSDPARIPAQHVLAREPLGLLADGITRGDALEAANNAISGREGHDKEVARTGINSSDWRKRAG